MLGMSIAASCLIFDFKIMLQLTEADQELYKNFPLVISERWQGEVAETVFETINLEADRIEHKKKAKQKQRFDTDEKGKLLVILLVLLYYLFSGISAFT